jgi:hypothetical protein
MRLSLVAAGLTLFVLAGLAVGARCLSLTRISCTATSFWTEQPELDVPYAETRSEVVAKMLELAAVGPRDYVIDLGTGDGRILIAAARDHGARGLGVDLDPALIDQARDNAEEQGVAGRVYFRTLDLFETPVGEATVITMFLLPEVNLQLRPRILGQMQPGARVVSHAFDMGDWRPDAEGRVGGSRVYLWIVPARVDGRWRLVREDGGSAELILRQNYQRIGGALTSAGETRRIRDSQLRGDRIRFVADDGEGPRLYEGIVRGDVIEPVMSEEEGALRRARGWRAVRL